MQTHNYKSITPGEFNFAFEGGKMYVDIDDETLIFNKEEAFKLANSYNKGWLTIQKDNLIYLSFNGSDAESLIEYMNEYFRF